MSRRVRCVLLLLALVLCLASHASAAFFGFNNHANAAAERRRVVDYYEVLQLEDKRENATASEIKTHYRRLSRQYHPDHADTEADRLRYADIIRAYEVLSDRRKRKMYDMRGEDGLALLARASAQRDGAANNPFAQLFGMQVQDQFFGPNMSMRVDIPLEHAFTGTTFDVTVMKQKLCSQCKGSGAEPNAGLMRCPQCHGAGVVRQRQMIGPNMYQEFQTTCPRCSGARQVPRRVCPVCEGRRVVRGPATLQAVIEPGITEGHELVFEMEADEAPDRIPGDCVLAVHTKPHPVFTRNRNGVDLETTLRLTMREALLGFSRTLTHLDGKEQVVVQASKVPFYGAVMKVMGKGMPVMGSKTGKRGDLYVTVEFALPTTLTEAQRHAIEQAFE